MKQVVTYQSPTGSLINVCPECELNRTSGQWFKDSTGQEYCRVHHGLHKGTCDVCEGDHDPAE